MADPFLRLPMDQRAEALAVAADVSGRPDTILEKDVWVVWALGVLFDGTLAEHLCFKGGTSLSKAYALIERFSEDVDLTYDIREILADQLRGADADPIPDTRSQADRWTRAVRDRLPEWVESAALPEIRTRIAVEMLPAEMKADGCDLILSYEKAAATANAYVPPQIRIEFGARSTGEPLQLRPVVCDAATHLPTLTFPEASPRTMAPERTFWEKATAAHVFCFEERLRGERYARHWYDLVRLDDAGVAATALADRDSGRRVASHKNRFFIVSTADGERIDYTAAIEGGLRLVPPDDGRRALEDDYRRMVEAGLLEDHAPSFDEIMEQCSGIEGRANSAQEDRVK
jgi:hypothetical protein